MQRVEWTDELVNKIKDLRLNKKYSKFDLFCSSKCRNYYGYS